MWYSSAIAWLKGTDRITGLEIFVDADQQKEYRLVQLKNKGARIDLESSLLAVEEEALMEVLPAGVPVVMVLTGRGVIHRTYQKSLAPISETLRNLFPDIKEEDFYFQTTDTASGGILSLIRKDLVHERIKILEAKKIPLLALSLGPFVSARLMQILNVPSAVLTFDRYIIHTDTIGTIQEYSIADSGLENTIPIGDELITGKLLNAYAGACSFLVHTSHAIEYPNCAYQLFQEANQEYKARVLKKRGGMVLLIAILTILLINFFIYTSLRKENSILEDKLQGVSNRLAHLDSLENYIHVKKDFMDQAGWSEKIILSKYCDQIAASIPPEVRLTELTLHPLNASVSRKTKETVFEHKKIVLKGATKKIVALNDWIKKIPASIPVKEFKMEEYHFDPVSQEGFFTLEGAMEQQ